MPRVARASPARRRAGLAAARRPFQDAVGLYHMLLEGVVFTAGQFSPLALVGSASGLPGLRQRVELVLRDERWQVGFWTHCLSDAGEPPALAARILRPGLEAADARAGAAVTSSR